MCNVVIDRPYVFVPPYFGWTWPWLLQKFVRHRLRRVYGIEHVECRGLENLTASRTAGHGILIAPNHCRPADPFVISELARQAGELPFTLASWHLFMQGRVQSWLLRRAGVFSIYREGADRAALTAATEILANGNRPLVIFPEGVITRTNDRLSPLMDGTALIARAAAKKRANVTPPGQVVVHAVALRYKYHGPIEQALMPALDDLESRLSWRPQRELTLMQRITKVGTALLGLKELEYMNACGEGDVFERVDTLIQHILAPFEQEWVQGNADGSVVARVKRLRAAILPEMIQGSVTGEERQRRWRQLGDMYLAQQLSYYPRDYLGANPQPDRMLETVERFEEDLTGMARRYSPMKVIAQVAPAIPVSPARERRTTEDPVMSTLDDHLRGMLAELQ